MARDPGAPRQIEVGDEILAGRQKQRPVLGRRRVERLLDALALVVDRPGTNAELGHIERPAELGGNDRRLRLRARRTGRNRGGAGSLIHPDGSEETSQPDFPEAARPNSLKGKELLEALRKTSELDRASRPGLARPSTRSVGPTRTLASGESAPMRVESSNIAGDEVSPPSWE